MKFDNRAQGSQLARRRLAVGATAAVMGLTAVLSTGLTAAARADVSASAPLTGIILGVGANESQRVVSWYSSVGTAQVVEVVPTSSSSADSSPSTPSPSRPRSPRTASTAVTTVTPRSTA
ncbi:hypothetical protein ACFQX6_61125 [Streptosporangium lutulentum]